MSEPLSLVEHPYICSCRAHVPLELREHRGYLVFARFCGCGAVVDVRAKFIDWMAVSQLLLTLFDQAQRNSA